ncbi:hypothetical protein ACM786_26770 [Pseudomonas aeruginosa]
MSELNKESVEQAGGDERAAFEVWASPLGWKLSPDQNNCGIVVAERYGHPGVQRCWEAWQARAALAQPSPAQAEKAEVERTDVVAVVRAQGFGRVCEADANALYQHCSDGETLMTVAQHERIVKAWIERWKAYIELSAKIAAQRDAALARVAELEAKLSDPTAVHQWQFSNAWFDGSEEVVLKAGKEGSPIRTLYAAPVVQAQHSVPKEFIGRLSEFLAQRGATGKALLRELRALCAAAPGKEVGHE